MDKSLPISLAISAGCFPFSWRAFKRECSSAEKWGMGILPLSRGEEPALNCLSARSAA